MAVNYRNVMVNIVGVINGFTVGRAQLGQRPPKGTETHPQHPMSGFNAMRGYCFYTGSDSRLDLVPNPRLHTGRVHGNPLLHRDVCQGYRCLRVGGRLFTLHRVFGGEG